MKKLSILFLALCCFSCAELQQAANSLPQQGTGLSQAQIANGLKEALNKGIDKQVSKLTKTNGFYKNQLVKISLPPELKKVEEGLRDIGLGSLVDDGIKAINRAAEDAVSKATPIFIDAVKDMSFTDAKSILLGNDNSATNYLGNKTNRELYSEFNPVIKNSFQKVGADRIWSNLITKYNSIPLTENVNPDLTDYVTGQALDGVYKMIGKEEKKIREKVGARNTQLLRKVFALQD